LAQSDHHRLSQGALETARQGGKHSGVLRNYAGRSSQENAEYSVPQLRMMVRETGAILGREILLAEWDRL